MFPQSTVIKWLSVSYCSALIEFLVKENNLAADIYGWLHHVYRHVSMGTSSVRRCVKPFKDGNMDIANQPHCVCLGSNTTDCNKHKIYMTIKQDWRVMVRKSQLNSWRRTLCHTGDDNAWDVGKLLPIGFPAYLQMNTERHVWVCHHSSFRNILPRAMTSCLTSWLVMKAVSTILTQKQNGRVWNSITWHLQKDEDQNCIFGSQSYGNCLLGYWRMQYRPIHAYAHISSPDPVSCSHAIILYPQNQIWVWLVNCRNNLILISVRVIKIIL